MQEEKTNSSPDQLIDDIETAKEAATLTDELIKASNIPKGKRNKFAEDIGNVAVSQAERTVGLERDKVTGLHWDHIMRNNTARRLKQGETGTILVMDLVGLKHLNTYGHEIGDQGLIVVAKFLKGYGFDEIGRKGDEFYCFLQGKNAASFRNEFQKYLEEEQKNNNLTLKTKDLTKELSMHWNCNNVNSLNELDDSIAELDISVENLKKQILTTIASNLKKIPKDENHLELVMLYHNQRKRESAEDISTWFDLINEQEKQRLKNEYGIEEKEDNLAEKVLQNISQKIKDKFSQIEKQALTNALELLNNITPPED